MMNWTTLNQAEQLREIKSSTGHSIIFKHSTRCSISLMAKRRVEQDWNDLPDDTSIYFLDLLSYRDLSHQIAELFDVHHESPQLLLIKDGECILNQSHGDISVDEVNEVLEVR
ncbi:MAG TPA: bacillithiol system redox-active protein YtxJ [Sphingobacteriaceae bacterium]